MSILKIYDSAVAALQKLKWLPPLVARISLGLLFAESGWGKIHNLSQVTEYFTTLNIPYPHFNAALVAYTELIGGGLLMLGLFSRLASIPLIISMIVAILTAKREDYHELTDLFGFEEYLFVVLLLWVLIEGAGLISLDHYLGKKRK